MCVRSVVVVVVVVVVIVVVVVNVGEDEQINMKGWLM